MVQRANQPLSFLSGFVESRDVAYVIATVDALVEKGSISTWLMKWNTTVGKWANFVVDWQLTRMWALKGADTQVFATGPQGRVLIRSSRGIETEEIDDTPSGPQGRGPIRDLRGIGGHLYACGMSRQVYRRTGPNKWLHVDQGTVLPLPTKKGGRPKPVVVGFNSIDGLDEDDIFAVGFGGEIWRRQKNAWHQLESPTNVMLNRVRVVDTNLAFASGQKGVLLRGRGSSWERIKHDAAEKDFWGMEWFQNSLYLATDDAVYRLGKKDTVDQVDMGIFETCGHLHANDGVLWSFGIKHLASTKDGATWTDMTP